jgi:hypothetical protein
MKIFISYRRINKDKLPSIIDDLKYLNHHVWYDNDITGGKEWWDEICSEIEKCDIFVPMLSDEYLESVPCMLESSYANDLKRHFLPILIGEITDTDTIPDYIAKIQYIDGKDSKDKDYFKGLAKASEKFQSPPQLPDPTPKRPEIPLDAHLSSIEEKLALEWLSWDKQNNIFNELENLYKKKSKQERVEKSLRKLQQRKDIYLQVYNQILSLLQDSNGMILDNLNSIDNIEEHIEAIYHALKRVIDNREDWFVGQLKLSLIYSRSVFLEATSFYSFDPNLVKKIQKDGWLKSRDGLKKSWYVAEYDIHETYNTITDEKIKEIAKEIYNVSVSIGNDYTDIYQEEYPPPPNSPDDIPF